MPEWKPPFLSEKSFHTNPVNPAPNFSGEIPSCCCCVLQLTIVPQSRIKEKVSHFIIKKSCYWRVDSLGSGEHKHESFEKIEAAVLICSSK